MSFSRSGTGRKRRFGRLVRAGFWYVGADRLVAAKIRQEFGELVLERCAGLDCSLEAEVDAAEACGFGAGELAALAGVARVPALVALGPPFARIVPRKQLSTGRADCDDDGVDDGHAGMADVPLVADGAAGSTRWSAGRLSGGGAGTETCLVDRAALMALVARLRVPGRRIVAVESAVLARAALTGHLGLAADAAADPLAALVVEPRAERVAAELGPGMDAAVGLALRAFGFEDGR